MGLLGHDIPLEGEKKKKEKIPSIVANDWVLDLDAQYETEDNPGIGHCAGFTLCLLFLCFFLHAIFVLLFSVCTFCRQVVKAPVDGKFDVKWVDEQQIPCAYDKLLKVPKPGAKFRGEDGKWFKVLSYKPSEVKLQILQNANTSDQTNSDQTRVTRSRRCSSRNNQNTPGKPGWKKREYDKSKENASNADEPATTNADEPVDEPADKPDATNTDKSKENVSNADEPADKPDPTNADEPADEPVLDETNPLVIAARALEATVEELRKRPKEDIHPVSLLAFLLHAYLRHRHTFLLALFLHAYLRHIHHVLTCVVLACVLACLSPRSYLRCSCMRTCVPVTAFLLALFLHAYLRRMPRRKTSATTSSYKNIRRRPTI